MRFELSWLGGGPMAIRVPEREDFQVLKVWDNLKMVYDDELEISELWTRGGRIVDPEPDGHFVINDLGGRLLAPGFIDVQINGGWGFDLNEDTEKALEALSAGLPSKGVTSFLPTLVSSAPEKYKEVERISLKGRPGAVPLGWHLEGPFLSQLRCGAHDPKLILNLKKGIASLDEVYGELGKTAMMVTIAPELENALDVIQELNERGVIVSLGHSDASLSQGELAVHRGARCLTHLWNAMSPLGGRQPGLSGLLTSPTVVSRPYFTIIADGTHIHPAALKVAMATHPKGCVVITDAVAPFGLQPSIKKFSLGTLKIEGRDNAAYVDGTWTLAGAVSPQIKSIPRLIDIKACDLPRALSCVTEQPASLLRLQDRGSLRIGYRADMVLLDPHLSVLATWVDGKPAYVNPSYFGPL